MCFVWSHILHTFYVLYCTWNQGYASKLNAHIAKVLSLWLPPATKSTEFRFPVNGYGGYMDMVGTWIWWVHGYGGYMDMVAYLFIYLRSYFKWNPCLISFPISISTITSLKRNRRYITRGDKNILCSECPWQRGLVAVMRTCVAVTKCCECNLIVLKFLFICSCLNIIVSSTKEIIAVNTDWIVSSSSQTYSPKALLNPRVENMDEIECPHCHGWCLFHV